MLWVIQKDIHARNQSYDLIEALTRLNKQQIKNMNKKELTEKFLYTAVSQLDNLLRLDGLKSILCNRHNNINFDNIEIL